MAFLGVALCDLLAVMLLGPLTFRLVGPLAWPLSAGWRCVRLVAALPRPGAFCPCACRIFCAGGGGGCCKIQQLQNPAAANSSANLNLSSTTEHRKTQSSSCTLQLRNRFYGPLTTPKCTVTYGLANSGSCKFLVEAEA